MSASPLPFVVWLMLAFFEDLPRELEQSAMIGRLRTAAPLHADLAAARDAGIGRGSGSHRLSLLERVPDGFECRPQCCRHLAGPCLRLHHRQGHPVGIDVGHEHGDRPAGRDLRPLHAALPRPRPHRRRREGLEPWLP